MDQVFQVGHGQTNREEGATTYVCLMNQEFLTGPALESMEWNMAVLPSIKYSTKKPHVPCVNLEGKPH